MATVAQPISPRAEDFAALPENEFAELYQLQDDLGALIAEGLIQPYHDNANVLRFRPKAVVK